MFATFANPASVSTISYRKFLLFNIITSSSSQIFVGFKFTHLSLNLQLGEFLIAFEEFLVARLSRWLMVEMKTAILKRHSLLHVVFDLLIEIGVRFKYPISVCNKCTFCSDDEAFVKLSTFTLCLQVES